jgi:hypothetical protein
MMTNIWRTDWTDEEWAEGTAVDVNPDACIPAGPSGVLGKDAWFTDMLSVENSTEREMYPRDFWSSYRLPHVVADLPRFNLSDAQANPDDYFVPVQCRDPATAHICGVAYVFSIYWGFGAYKSTTHFISVSKSLILTEFP